MKPIHFFDSAAECLSKPIRDMLTGIDEKTKEETYEIRLRAERPFSLYGKYGTLFPSSKGELTKNPEKTAFITSANEVREIFNRICTYSVHTFHTDVIRGYIPMKGGNRAGVCGTAVCENGNVVNVKDITSINIRIGRYIPGAGDEILEKASIPGESIIIAGSPGSGKTTVLRDIAVQISEGKKMPYIKTAIIDERREITSWGEKNYNLIGCTSDILISYPKAQAIDIAVRTLSPQVIVCDEVSDLEEINAVRRGVNCGCTFIVTVHAGSLEEIISRRQTEELLLTYSFKKLFLLGSSLNPGKLKEVYEAGDLLNEISYRRLNFGNMCADRY